MPVFSAVGLLLVLRVLVLQHGACILIRGIAEHAVASGLFPVWPETQPFTPGLSDPHSELGAGGHRKPILCSLFHVPHFLKI